MRKEQRIMRIVYNGPVGNKLLRAIDGEAEQKTTTRQGLTTYFRN